MIDSSSNYSDKQITNGYRQPNYSTATITKRRNPIRGQSVSSAHNVDIGLSTLEFTNIEIETNTPSIPHESNGVDQNQASQQYEDIIDVQVIAKMQEECKYFFKFFSLTYLLFILFKSNKHFGRAY